MTAPWLPEFALSTLVSILEYHGKDDAAARVEAVYDRMIYTDRGPAPTDAEVQLLVLDVAPGLEFDRDRLEWRPRGAK